MDPVAIASAVFGGFSALSDAINLYRSYREKGETPPAEEIEREMQESEAAAKAKPSAAQRLKKVIDNDVLDVIRGVIDKAKERFLKSMKEPSNDAAARDHAEEIANHTICAELNRIKRLNGGNLPGKEYDKWWQAHGCTA